MELVQGWRGGNHEHSCQDGYPRVNTIWGHPISKTTPSTKLTNKEKPNNPHYIACPVFLMGMQHIYSVIPKKNQKRKEGAECRHSIRSKALPTQLKWKSEVSCLCTIGLSDNSTEEIQGSGPSRSGNCNIKTPQSSIEGTMQNISQAVLPLLVLR